jgi:hypothetical protein
VQGIVTAQQRAANARAFRERVPEHGLDVGTCRVMVKVYNEERARPRNIGPQHIDGDALTEALDVLEGGDRAGAAAAFGRAWLDAYGMDDVDATITAVVGAVSARLWCNRDRDAEAVQDQQGRGDHCCREPNDDLVARK